MNKRGELNRIKKLEIEKPLEAKLYLSDGSVVSVPDMTKFGQLVLSGDGGSRDLWSKVGSVLEPDGGKIGELISMCVGSGAATRLQRMEIVGK